MAHTAFENIRIKYRRKIYTAAALITGVVLIGILGFIIIEHYTIIEAFYMTIITIGTVGFNEVKPLDNAGRIFTSILIILNLAIFAYAISSISTFISQGELKKYFKVKRLQKQIEKLSAHIIVCGYGRNGKQVCDVLENSHQSYVVIESDEKRLELLSNNPNALFVLGNATDDAVLNEAGIATAKALITTLPEDPDNVFVVLATKEKNPNIHIISRASDESSEVKLRRAGADNVIMPEKIGGSYMASLILRPDLVEFISTLTGRSQMNFAFEEVPCTHLPSDGKPVTLKDLNVFKKYRVLVIGIKKEDGQYIYNPPPNTHITRDTKLIMLGSEEHVREVKKFLEKNHGSFLHPDLIK